MSASLVFLHHMYRNTSTPDALQGAGPVPVHVPSCIELLRLPYCGRTERAYAIMMFNILLNNVVFQERHLPLKGKSFSSMAICFS